MSCADEIFGRDSVCPHSQVADNHCGSARGSRLVAGGGTSPFGQCVRRAARFHRHYVPCAFWRDSVSDDLQGETLALLGECFHTPCGVTSVSARGWLVSRRTLTT